MKSRELMPYGSLMAGSFVGDAEYWLGFQFWVANTTKIQRLKQKSLVELLKTLLE